MTIEHPVTQLYHDCESRNPGGVFEALPDGFWFEWPGAPQTAR